MPTKRVNFIAANPVIPAQLTARQQRVFDLVKEVIEQTGMPPTRAEIAARLGFRSPNAAEEHLRVLARKGVIELLSGASRGIRLLVDDSASRGLPIIGRVAAGQPILANAHIEDYYRFDASIFKPRADYLLRVHGSSMRDIGILDEDLLAVHATPEAGNGQIVVVRLDDEVTVKRFYRRGSRIQLLAENPDFAPIEINLRRQALVVEGLAVGVLRIDPC